MNLLTTIHTAAEQLAKAQLAFGHGTTNALDEAAWLVLWQLKLPQDTDLNDPTQAHRPLTLQMQSEVQQIIDERIRSRLPAAYLTREAWLQGFAFYVDERAIVPRSLIAELLVNGDMDYWLSPHTQQVLDLCTGNGSLAVIAASVYPEVHVTGADISNDALAVARINVNQHSLQHRIDLVTSDGLRAFAESPHAPAKQFDLILCNPPYVNAASMAALPQEYLAEPTLALASGIDGMDFTRQLLSTVAKHMSEQAVLVLEIGNEREHFEAAFEALEVVWLETSAGEDQVLLITRNALLRPNGFVQSKGG